MGTMGITRSLARISRRNGRSNEELETMAFLASPVPRIPQIAQQPLADVPFCPVVRVHLRQAIRQLDDLPLIVERPVRAADFDDGVLYVPEDGAVRGLVAVLHGLLRVGALALPLAVDDRHAHAFPELGWVRVVRQIAGRANDE